MGARRRRAERRAKALRRLEIDGLESRQLLAAEVLNGTVWEEVWRGRMGDASTVEAQLGAHADFNGDGHSDLMVAHAPGNQVLLGAADGSYGDAIGILGPYVPSWLAADIDNDGDPDLLTTSENMLLVLINAGHVAGKWAGFEQRPGEPLGLPGGDTILQLTSADLSGDGRTDLVVGTTEGVFVRMADANNSLGPAIAYPLRHGEQRRLVSGDFDQDGDLDLVSASSSYTGASLDLLVNEGGGIFEPRATGGRLSNYIRDLVAGDLDRDGDTDLVVAYQYSYDGNLEVMTNDGQGGFAGEPTRLTVAGSPTQLALGDVDGDGDFDLVVSHYGGLHIPYSGAPGVSVFMGQSNGSWGSRQYMHRSDSRAVMIEMLGAGPDRRLTVFTWNGGIQVLRPMTPDLFPAEVATDGDDWSTPGDQNIVATGDWNGDGLDDVIDVNQRFGGQVLRVSLGLARPDDTYLWTELPLYEDGQSWIIAELTGDDRPDIGLVRFSVPSFVVLPQTETGVPGNPMATQLPGTYWNDTGAYDLNEDQLPDLFLRGDTGSVRALFGSGAGQFTLGPVIVTASEMRVADLNGDARPDLVAISGSTLRSLMGQSDGTFQESFRVSISADSFMQVWQDFTSDGQADLMLSSGATLESRIFTGGADGTFREVAGSPLPSSGHVEPAFPDIDLDGRGDLLIVASEVGKIIVWKTNVDGTLADPVETEMPRQAYPYLQQDINGDELLDFVVASQTRAAVLLGRADGTFLPAFEPLRVTNGLAHVSVDTDFNSDTHNDLLFLSSAGLQIWVWDIEGSLAEFFELPLPAREFWVNRADDFNGDEVEDFIYVEASTNRSHVLVSGSETPFVAAFSFPADANVVGFADLTGDGAADALTQTWTGELTIWRNQGDWTFTSLDLEFPEFVSVVTTDFNGDGLADLVGQAGDSLTAWLNVDGSSFREYFDMHMNGSLGFGQSSDTIARGDLNHDGHGDIVVGWPTPGPGQRVTLLLSEADGSFARPLTYVFPRPFNLAHVVLGDVDDDGDLDITLEGRDLTYYGESTEITRRGVITNQADQYWPVGDADRNGRFNSADLVAVFAAGEYEDAFSGNSAWLEGDWNRDGDFTSQDLVLAFQRGTYVAAAETIDPVDLDQIAAHLAARKFTLFPADDSTDGKLRSLSSLYET